MFALFNMYGIHKGLVHFQLISHFVCFVLCIYLFLATWPWGNVKLVIRRGFNEYPWKVLSFSFISGAFLWLTKFYSWSPEHNVILNPFPSLVSIVSWALIPRGHHAEDQCLCGRIYLFQSGFSCAEFFPSWNNKWGRQQDWAESLYFLKLLKNNRKFK